MRCMDGSSFNFKANDLSIGRMLSQTFPELKLPDGMHRYIFLHGATGQRMLENRLLSEYLERGEDEYIDVLMHQVGC